MERPEAKEGDSRARDRRAGKMAAVADLVRNVTPNHGVDWPGLVGAMLGALSVPVGVNDVGVLRVMAVNETAKRELVARADNLLGVWNAAAQQKDGREATSLECWVREGLKPPSAVRQPRPVRVPPPSISPALVADAEAMVGPMAESSVRDAMVEMRAKALAAKRERTEGEA